MRKQAIRLGATGTVGVILALALTGMINWLGARHYVRGDWTRSKVYTLSQKTLGILKGLDQDVKVIVFMTPGSQLYPQVSELLSRYAAASDKITVETIDPDRERLKTQQLAQQYGISAANTVVFSAGDRTKYVTSDQMAEMDYSGMQMGQAPKIKAFKGEEQFTAAILSLVAPRVPKVYVVTGHGEASVAGGGGAQSGRSIHTLIEALKRENMTAADTSLLGGTIPEDADVLAILGPTAPYSEAEVDLLQGYLAKGGRVLVCLDPLIERDGTMGATRLEGLLGTWGVKVNDDLVVDPSRRLPFFDLSAVYLQDFRPHPVTTGMEGLAVLFPVTRSLAAESGDGHTATDLVMTSSDGWGETDLKALLAGQPVKKDDSDVQGPVAVAVASQGSSTEGAPPSNPFRLVAFGDSDFLTDAQIANAGNQTLALNAFNWLAARNEALGIAPHDVEQVNLFLDAGQMTSILLICLLAMPGAAILAGVLVWRRRRH